MIKITIDDKKCTVPDGITIIEAARQNGIHIPALGYDPRLSPPSGAELSTVELLDGDNVRFVSATSTKVAPGMKIRTESPALESFRKIYLQSLLRNHYGDCVAPCVQRCPANVDIQRYLYHVAAGNFTEALAVIKENNPCPPSAAASARIPARPNAGATPWTAP
jgi:formate dehydrogenase major subunit